MKTFICRYVSSMAAAAFLVCAGSSLSAQILVKNRIAGPIRSEQVTVVRGSVHPLVAIAKDEGELSASTPIHGMSLLFRRSAAQQADLNSLLAQQQVHGSSLFHQWLNPAQFATRYGVSQSDLQATAKWLQSQGFSIDKIPSSADRIDFSGTAAQVETAFHTQMHRYNLHGTEHWANSTELSFPQAIAGMVIGVRNLNTFRPVPSHLKRHPVHVIRKPGSTVAHPEYTLEDENGNLDDFLAPADIQTIYDITPLYNASISGTGQYIGIMGQTDITQYMSDIQTFRSLSGLNASNVPTQVVVPGTGAITGEAAAGAASGDLGESDLDVELSGAVAKDANIIYVTVGNDTNYGVFDSLQYAIQTALVNNGQDVIPVLSISYGNCEQNFQQSDIESIVELEQEANAQGQTVVAASGDNGSADCDGTVNNVTELAATLGLAVDFPGSSPYTTTAGGTSFVADISNVGQYWNQSGNYTTSTGATNGSALSYIPEGAWNDTPNALLAQQNGGLGAGGGGISEVFNAAPNNSVAAPPAAPVLPAALSYLAGKPSWQVGPGVPSDGARDVPDISLSADPNHDGYVLCTQETDTNGNITGPSCVNPVNASLGEVPYFDANGSGEIYGGTSAAAPQLAAMITLWNQAAGYVITSTNAGGVGNANYMFYQLAQTTPSAFHDAVSSSNAATNSNAVVCKQGTPSCIADPTTNGNYIMAGYSVGTGYDLATGLGSVDVAAMSTVWGSASAAGSSYENNLNPQPDFQVVANPGTVALSKGASTPVTIKAIGLDGFTGAITLTCTGPTANPGITCNFGGASTTTVNPGSSVALTIVASGSASLQRPRIFPHQQPQHPQNSQEPWQRLAGGGMAFAAIFLMGLPGQRRRWMSRLGKHAKWGTMAVLLLVVCVGITLGCGSSTSSGGGGTPGGGGTTPTSPPASGPTPNLSSIVEVTATATISGTATTHIITVAYTGL